MLNSEGKEGMKNRYQRTTQIVLSLLLMVGGISMTQADSRKEVRKEIAQAKARVQQSIRGSLVYNTYCTLCHGKSGDGVGRAIKLYGDINLAITKRGHDYFEKIIRGGGEAVGRSLFMPTWSDELSDEQISDVVEYLAAVTDPVQRGEIVFKTNCILCHGIKGNGKGRSARLYNPPPADLTRSDKNDDYKRMIITLGGKAMGRSEVMPVWGEQITPQEIDDVVAYLKTILVTDAPQ